MLHMDLELLLLWAKSSRTDSRFHPLLCHMVDVGEVARALWRGALSEGARRQVSRSLDLDERQAERWIAVWAGLHDIGKASPAFAFKNPLLGDALAAAGFARPLLPYDTGHGIITACTLREILPELGLGRPLVDRVSVVLGGHHGSFPRSDELDPPYAAIGGGRWKRARRDLAFALASHFKIAEAGIPRALDNATAMFLAGLVSVADWIGSIEDLFGYAAAGPGLPVALDTLAYAAEAEARATEALRLLGWTGWGAPALAGFADLFPDLEANSLQREIVRVAEGLDAPALVLIEAPMGEGKTEAAMYLADRWGATRSQGGCYFALPTQATSNQMFDRVREFLSRRYPTDRVNLQLVHGHATLSPAFQELRKNEERLLRLEEVYGAEGDDRASANVIAAEWFTHRKRPLLAPFGVGTVDQALLAALQSRHVFVRLFGLARKVLVIDEVHAYDTYMSALLERLLEWTAALGSSVVLLSATLPEGRRGSLLQAYERGLGISTDIGAEPAASYPRLTWTNRNGSGSRAVQTSARSTKSVRVKWVDGSLPAAPERAFPLGEKLDRALAHGGCAVVICNTVARAQRLYNALKTYFPSVADDGFPELDLLHARYPFAERGARERRSMVRFGKPDGAVVTDDGAPGNVRRPNRAVLVATQIVEQSLDLDFDLMITDLAPVDLVLQRVGRLHRHVRPRPDGLAEPKLWIMKPALDGANLPDFGELGKVYEEYVLLRSWLTLKDLPEIAIPSDVERLIEAVYADDGGNAADGPADPALDRRLREARKQLEEQRASDKDEAERRWLQRPDYPDRHLWRLCQDAREEDAPDFHREHQALTRLAEPTVQVVCLYGSRDRPYLDAGHTRPVDPSVTPGVDLARDLLASSLSVADKRVVFMLMAQPAPSGWRSSPLLRHHRLLAFDRDGRMPVGPYQVVLDGEIGLTVESLAKA